MVKLQAKAFYAASVQPGRPEKPKTAPREQRAAFRKEKRGTPLQ